MYVVPGGFFDPNTIIADQLLEDADDDRTLFQDNLILGGLVFEI